MNYSTGRYFDQESGRSRWAVFCATSRTWLFPERYGQRAADALAKRLNQEIKP